MFEEWRSSDTVECVKVGLMRCHSRCSKMRWKFKVYHNLGRHLSCPLTTPVALMIQTSVLPASDVSTFLPSGTLKEEHGFGLLLSSIYREGFLRIKKLAKKLNF
jgi:hypothetical protein